MPPASLPRAAVQPVTRSFVAGQTVVARGQVVTPGDLEALTALGLIQPKDPLYSLLGAAALVLLLTFLRHCISRFISRRLFQTCAVCSCLDCFLFSSCMVHASPSPTGLSSHTFSLSRLLPC